jgi:glycosyltransferase involved in cell wall biosynthesis
VDKTTPKLSIITVNLNNAVGLRKTLASAIYQTFSNYEHIIIDGGSTDGSVEILKDYEAKYNGIKDGLFWVSEPDNGIYNAMNKGIKEATGDYCLFLNSGDTLYASKTIMQVIEKIDNYDIIYGDIIYQHTDTELRYVKSKERVCLSLFNGGSLPHPSTFIRRALFNQYGFYDENNKVVSDFEFFLKVFIADPSKFKHVNIPISIFDCNGISSDPKYKQLRNNEKEAVKLKYLPFVVWQEIEHFNHINNKYNGLISSGSVRLILKLKSFLNYFFN